MITIEIAGLDALCRKVDPRRLEAALDEGIQRSAQVLRDESKRLPPVSAARTGYGAKGIPVDTGRLRQSIQARRTRLMGADVFTNAGYGGFVHRGTSRVPPRPFFLWALRDFGGREKIERTVRDILSRLLR